MSAPIGLVKKALSQRFRLSRLEPRVPFVGDGGHVVVVPEPQHDLAPGAL